MGIHYNFGPGLIRLFGAPVFGVFGEGGEVLGERSRKGVQRDQGIIFPCSLLSISETLGP